MTGRGQHGLTKKKSCLTNLIDFSREVTSLINDGRAVHIVYLKFIKAFGTVSLSPTLLEKFTKNRTDKSVCLFIYLFVSKVTENWLNVWAQRVVISGTKSSGCQSVVMCPSD